MEQLGYLLALVLKHRYWLLRFRSVWQIWLERSVRLNGLEEQMQVICDDLKNMPSRIQGSKVDMILCNPPYFKVDPHSNLNESEHYLLARHEITTNLQEICRSAQSILKSNGRLAMVHRPDRLLDI